MSVLHNIRCLCKEKGITLAQLEKEVGYKSKAIFQINPNSSADKLNKIAKLLGTTVDALLEDKTND